MVETGEHVEEEEEEFVEAPEYNGAVHERKILRAKITRIHTKVTTRLENDRRVQYLDQIKDYKVRLNHLNNRINEYAGEDELEAILEAEELYEDRIHEVLRILQPYAYDDTNQARSLGGEPSNKLKLPVVPLPEFSNHKGESYESFISAFESIMFKHSLSQYELFIYLKGQLKGGPLTLINSLNPTEQTFDKAKQLLKEAFASTLSQQYDVIRRLSELKLNLGDDVYKFISEMRCLTSSFDALKIDIDVVIQFFVWRGMNDRFQNQFIQITNCSKPTLTEINTHLFAATDRYLRIGEQINDRKKQNFKNTDQYKREPFQKKYHSPIKTNMFAAKVKTKTVYYCVLCVADSKNNVNHVLKDCTVYSSAKDKISRLKSLNFCSKCSFKNHNDYNCKFVFSTPCRSCGENHLTFLCPRDQKFIRTNVSSACFNGDTDTDNEILPTFTAEAVGTGGLGERCRILSDSGSQRNFILEKVAQKLKLSIIRESVGMTVHGVNADKSMITNVVKVPVKISDSVVVVKAVVVPKINMNMKIDNLPDIVREFRLKGYHLADELLGESEYITDFDMVWGNDTSRFLVHHSVVVGEGDECSAYLQSKIGVLLGGESSYWLNNLKYLPSLISDSNLNDSFDVDTEVKFKCDSGIEVKDAFVNFNTVQEVLNEEGELVKSKLDRATDEALEQYSNSFLDCDNYVDEEFHETNDQIIRYVLDNTDRASNGRLIMPLPWNPECKHLLGQNYKLSRQILNSNLRKLKKNDLLGMYDQVFKEQESLGIIEKITDVEAYIYQNPDVSFLPHTGVVKLSRDTTKVRVVLLSNLCEPIPNQLKTVSHNNALLPGPCLNHKLSTSLLLSRFDKYILIFDITKAFLGIQLRESDQNKLLCLWYNSVETGDFSLVAYKYLRLSFGLRSSPAILMIALYKILVLDTENDDDEMIHLKRCIYNNIYMDNGLISSDSLGKLTEYYKCLPNIFGGYQFQLQQYATNDLNLQSVIDSEHKSDTDQTIKFFGIQWDRKNDSLSPFPIQLDKKAKTKRQILSSLNSVYDVFNVYGPMLNRAKLFLQRLQSQKSIDWDTILPQEMSNEWILICRQANSTPAKSIPRFIGSRGSTYTLVAFSDASAAIYGVVVYIIENISNKVSFLLAKNKVIGSKLSAKSIPSLECQGVALAVETLLDICSELGEEKNNLPIDIEALYVYTDSMVTLSWLKSYFTNYDKMQKRTTYIMNRLKQIGDLCKIKPVTFRYIAGHENPADYISRPVSYNRLKLTNYFCGPEFLKKLEDQPDIEVIVPGPLATKAKSDDFSCQSRSVTNMSSSVAAAVVSEETERHVDLAACEPLTEVSKYSSFLKLVRIHVNVLKFIYTLKVKIGKITPAEKPNLYRQARNILIHDVQKSYFPDVLEFFKSNRLNKSGIPNLVLQMNLYVDDDFIVRVKSKSNSNFHPILLPSNSHLVKIIILDTHAYLSHAGLYSTLRAIRKTFWILRGFSAVRRVLKDCVICRKLNGRPIKLNQSSYRDFRSDPPRIPFKSVFIDYIGPISIKSQGSNKKVWLLITTCLFSRAVSLQICRSADTREFLRNLQIHVYRYGLFSLCLSDLGSQIVAGTNLIANFLDDIECHNYFESNGIQKLTFEQYAKGNSSLGSLVECLVKQVKHLMIKSVGRNILCEADFELLVARVTSIVNRRPVAFQNSLRESSNNNEMPVSITPEMLLFGRELTSMNVIPELQPDSLDDPVYEPIDSIRNDYDKLIRVNKALTDTYHSEFCTQLISQAVDHRDRYKPVVHKNLSVGDLVLLVEPHTKQSNYPLGIVRKINTNSLGECTSAIIYKGSTREQVFRHSSSLILLLKNELSEDKESSDEESHDPVKSPPEVRPARKAALTARKKIRSQE